MKYFKEIVTACLMCTALTANASIIETGNYQRINGLDWLDLNETDEMTYAEVQTNFSGWSLATRDQFTTMFSEFETVGDDRISNIASLSIDNNVAGFEEIITNYHIGLDNQIYDYFGQIFGYTVESATYGYSTLGYYADGDNQAVGGIEIHNNPGILDVTATVRSFYDYTTYASTDGSFDGNRHAWFLVRAPRSNGIPSAGTIPEPSILALLGLGLLSIAVTRRRKI